MPQPVAEQVVVITGASSGIGRATALAFAVAGAKVVCAARSAEALGTLSSRSAPAFVLRRRRHDHRRRVGRRRPRRSAPGPYTASKFALRLLRHATDGARPGGRADRGHLDTPGVGRHPVP
ncbi:SDR family NAD(P)-dependent oxidoreductase [Paractinoplanes hotanensis]|uniref:SDR family NAD(P)-dependent oxidoreductase n=1 Tax=Paractinoplanes hotanensis TaxID=2906497 RepID=UPI00255B2F5B|nr:SDR family NAD(P)-dependent oxidoreductase [Actinoplanes hotanensis]